MDSADIVQSAWTLSRVSVDNVHTFHWVPWTMSKESMNFVQGDSGRMSIESMDIVQSEWAPWTLSQSIHGHCPDFPLIPWKMFRESMDIVQGDHGFSGHFTDQTSWWMWIKKCHKQIFWLQIVAELAAICNHKLCFKQFLIMVTICNQLYLERFLILVAICNQ